MCVLLVNHYMLAEGKVRQEELLEKIIELCLRIKRENDDMSMATQANQLHGICLLMLNRPAEVVDLLETDERYLTSSHSGILANAYLAMGKRRERKKYCREISTVI